MPIHTLDGVPSPFDDHLVREVYASLSTLASNHISVADVKLGLRKLGMPCTDHDAIDLIEMFRHGNLDMNSFDKFVKQREHQLHKRFLELDTDGSGFIDLEAFAKAICRLNPEFDTVDYLHMLSCFKYDNNSIITYVKFREGLLVLPTLHVAAMFDFWSRTAMDIGEDMTVPEEHVAFHKPLRTFIAGAVAGAVSRTATAPLDRLKVLLQASSNQCPSHSVRGGLLAIYQEGGLRAFWRGNGANVLKIAPESGIKFWVFDYVKRYLSADPLNATVLERLLAGSIAGVVSQTCIYPLETIKTRMAVVASFISTILYSA